MTKLAGNNRAASNRGKNTGSSRGGGSNRGNNRSGGYKSSAPGWLWGVVGLVVIAVVVIVVVATQQGSGTTGSTGAMAPSVVNAVTTGVSSSTLSKAGLDSSSVNNLPVSLGKQTPLTQGGKPEVLYIGAEYCPYCAAERWPLVLALSRFGKFSNLGRTTSSATDVYPSTPTFSFYKSSYTSQYLSFTSVELETNTNQPLQSPTKAQNALINKFDTAPYVQGSSGAIPFIDFGNRFIQSGSGYSPQLLQGLTYDNIAGQMEVPGTNVGSAIDADANVLTAAICVATGDQPGSICNATVIRQAISKIEANKPSSGSNSTPGAAG